MSRSGLSVGGTIDSLFRLEPYNLTVFVKGITHCGALVLLGAGRNDPRSHFQFFLPNQGQLLCFNMSAFVYIVLDNEYST